MSWREILGVFCFCFSLLTSNVTAWAAQEATTMLLEEAAGQEESEKDVKALEDNQLVQSSLFAYSGGRNIVLDGNLSDWKDIPTYSSSVHNVAKWAVAQNDKYVYLYVQINGGNQWGLPITNTSISITYADGTENDKSNGVRFAGMLTLKDNFYGDISGAGAAYAPSYEKDKYEIEAAIPQSFFKNSEFTIHYCGVSISAKEITVLNTLSDKEEEKPAYDGITVDGNFVDWNAVEKTSVNDGSILDVAVVFDGDWIYIYLKDVGNYAATSAGERSSGVYELLTDTGRRTSFKLRRTGIEGIEGALVEYSNEQYEIAIPASALKAYRSSISFGYTHRTPMLTGIVNMQGGGNINTTFAGITIDGSFGDWRDYNHTLIEYSTNGTFGDDADGALYIEENILYGHVQTYRYADEKNPYEPITLYFNHNDKKTISFRFISIDETGRISWEHFMDTSGAVKEYYLVDVAGWHGATTMAELQDAGYGNKILGRAFFKRGNGSDTEIEYEIYLETVAEYISGSDVHDFKIAATDMKTIEAQYINIGTQRIVIAGASSGAIVGLLLSIGIAASVGGYRRRKEKGIV